jgi:hypothetical protein
MGRQHLFSKYFVIYPCVLKVSSKILLLVQCLQLWPICRCHLTSSLFSNWFRTDERALLVPSDYVEGILLSAGTYRQPGWAFPSSSTLIWFCRIFKPLILVKFFLFPVAHQIDGHILSLSVKTRASCNHICIQFIVWCIALEGYILGVSSPFKASQ